MQDVELQKRKLAQKKNRLVIEETKLKLKERKARTRQLIEHGGLIAKAELDNLSTNVLFGALLSLTEQLNNNPEIINSWKTKGSQAFNEEQKSFYPVILQFTSEPAQEVRKTIRTLGLRFNRFRQEWYGNVLNLDELKSKIQNIEHKIEVLQNH